MSQPIVPGPSHSIGGPIFNSTSFPSKWQKNLSFLHVSPAVQISTNINTCFPECPLVQMCHQCSLVPKPPSFCWNFSCWKNGWFQVTAIPCMFSTVVADDTYKNYLVYSTKLQCACSYVSEPFQLGIHIQPQWCHLTAFLRQDLACTFNPFAFVISVQLKCV